MKKLYYFQTKNLETMDLPTGIRGNWGIISEDELPTIESLAQVIKQATLQDVEDLACASGDIFKEKIQLTDGNFKWSDRRFEYIACK